MIEEATGLFWYTFEEGLKVLEEDKNLGILGRLIKLMVLLLMKL